MLESIRSAPPARANEGRLFAHTRSNENVWEMGIPSRPGHVSALRPGVRPVRVTGRPVRAISGHAAPYCDMSRFRIRDIRVTHVTATTSHEGLAGRNIIVRLSGSENSHPSPFTHHRLAYLCNM